MFSTLKQRLLLGAYIFLLLSIPIGSFLVSKQQTITSKAQTQSSKSNPVLTPTPKKPGSEAINQILSVSESNLKNLQVSPSPAAESSSPTIATSFGPTLSLKVAFEGRPADKQDGKLFVGIVEGTLSTTLKFLLSFSINLPPSGEYTNLSLAGLSAGTKYTAILKGSAQIATSSAFIMAPGVTNLNDGVVINLKTGDLNEDNIINSADYSIIKKAYGANPSSPNWNEIADFNKDGVVNLFDLGIVSKNSGQTGASGVWTSPPPATSSASLGTGASAALNSGSTAQGAPSSTTEGYWLWLPK